MKKSLAIFVAGIAVGVLATIYIPAILNPAEQRVRPEDPGVCYSCLWDDEALRKDLINFYRQYRTPDPLVAADVMYILWRATEVPNCDVLKAYRRVAEQEHDPARRLGRNSHSVWRPGVWFLRFQGFPPGGQNRTAGRQGMGGAGIAGPQQASLSSALRARAIKASLHPPANATAMVLGESMIVLTPNMRIGAQVDRVARDWISYQLKWNLTDERLGTWTPFSGTTKGQRLRRS